MTISEGLATILPGVLQKKKITPRFIVDCGMMFPDDGKYCNEREDEIFDEIMEVWDSHMTRELWIKYFVSGKSGKGGKKEKPERIGYYVGSRIIGDLLNNGHNICELTRMPTDKIVELWNNNR